MPILARIAVRMFVVAALCLFVLATQSFSQKKPVSLEELTRNSEVVAVGQVKTMTSEWDESGTRIRTKVQLSVDQYVVGSGYGNTLTLYVPGGEVDGVGEIYSHMPNFKKQEQVMVFAAQDKLHHFHVSAGEEGKFSIQKDESGKIIVPGHASLEEFTTEVKNTVKRLQTQGTLQH